MMNFNLVFKNPQHLIPIFVVDILKEKSIKREINKTLNYYNKLTNTFIKKHKYDKKVSLYNLTKTVMTKQITQDINSIDNWLKILSKCKATDFVDLTNYKSVTAIVKHFNKKTLNKFDKHAEALKTVEKIYNIQNGAC